MKTQVEFRSSKFPPYEGEEETINPGMWGQRLAEYLAKKLSEQGVRVHEFVAEDWGYYIPVEFEGVKFAVCCGHQDGDDDQFLCFCDPNVLRTLFRRSDTITRLSGLVKVLEKILSSDPEI